MADRNYLYYDFTTSVCSQCLRKVEAKIIFQDEKVYMLKNCFIHGREKVLIATDIEYYKMTRNYLKPPSIPRIFNTEVKYGCPYDCGLCTDHEQHSCLAVVEITDRCNLTCPTCYAESSPHFGRHRTVEEVERMFDIVVANEGEPDVIQISGGEPTIHPDIFKIIDIAKTKPFKHIMLNTNGIKLAKDEEFVKRLASYMPGFEVYLQFDSFEQKTLEQIRGEDLRDVRMKAIDNLNKYNLSTTLVVTMQKGLNDHEIGKIIQFAIKQKSVRGVTFQPTQIAGRLKNFDPAADRITLTEIRNEIVKQSNLFTADDILPVPCNSDCLAMGYALKMAGGVFPLTRFINPKDLLEDSRNTIVYEKDDQLHKKIIKVFDTGQNGNQVPNNLQALLCCLPKVAAPNLRYDNIFRVIIMQFLDAYNFDVRAVKKSCVHIVHKDGRIIPFDTMNLFYRDGKEAYLKSLQEEARTTYEKVAK